MLDLAGKNNQKHRLVQCICKQYSAEISWVFSILPLLGCLTAVMIYKNGQPLTTQE